MVVGRDELSLDWVWEPAKEGPWSMFDDIDDDIPVLEAVGAQRISVLLTSQSSASIPWI